MKDIIYRDDAIKCCRNEWEEEVEERLRLLPTADVVEVVRCKDCDYSMGITEKKCPMWENIGDPNGYCKWWQSTTNER